MRAPVFVATDLYEADIGAHVFQTGKYRRTRELILASGRVGEDAFAPPADEGDDVLRLVHRPEYLEDLRALRMTAATFASELPLTEEIVRWFVTAVHGTVTATRAALTAGACYHVGGGFHHAFADRAEGFCYLNDVAVAARWAVEGVGVPSATVVDLDVHQGNGTARIFVGDDRVFTFSMHQENNYPVKERSDLDLGLPDGIEDEEYLRLLDMGLDRCVRARRPALVLYVAGADPYREDQLGGLSLTMEGLRERDRRVFAACRDVGAAAVVTLAGGYARDPEDTAHIHAGTAFAMLDAWPELAVPAGDEA